MSEEIIKGLPDHLLLFNIIGEFLMISYSGSSLLLVCKRLNRLILENDDTNFWEISLRNLIKFHLMFIDDPLKDFDQKANITRSFLNSKKRFRFRSYENVCLYTDYWSYKSKTKTERYLNSLLNNMNAVKQDMVNKIGKKLLPIVTLTMKRRRVISEVMTLFMNIQIFQLETFTKTPSRKTLGEFFSLWEKILDYIETRPCGFSREEIVLFHFGKKNLTLVHHFFKQLSVYYHPGASYFQLDEKFHSNRVYQFFNPMCLAHIKSDPHSIMGYNVLWSVYKIGSVTIPSAAGFHV